MTHIIIFPNKLKKTLESPLDCKEIKLVNPKGNQSWILIERTDAEAPILWPTWWEEPIHWKRPWCWERLKTGREGDNRGWVGGMAPPTRWTLSLSKLRELVTDRDAWRAVVHGVAVRHDWTTKLNRLQRFLLPPSGLIWEVTVPLGKSARPL